MGELHVSSYLLYILTSFFFFFFFFFCTYIYFWIRLDVLYLLKYVPKYILENSYILILDGNLGYLPIIPRCRPAVGLDIWEPGNIHVGAF